MDNTVAIAVIDVSKHKFDVHILPSNLVFTVDRDRRGLADLVRRLRKASIGEVALEASGDGDVADVALHVGRGHTLDAAHSKARSMKASSCASLLEDR